MIKVKQNRLSSLLSLLMSLVMCMGMFNITTLAADKEELTAGTYEVPVSLMNAGNIANPSMAASCINGNAVLNVANDGTRTITVNLKAVTVFGITAFSSDWKIYQGDSISSDTVNAVVTETDSDGNTTQISFTVPDNGMSGVYVNMTVSAMGMSPDAYIAIDYANASAFYTVTYTDGADGNVFENQVTENIMSGTETPAFNGTPSREGYTFMGWTPEVAETVTDNAIYTAKWEKIPEPVNPEQPTESNKDIKPGEYTVPIVSLTSNAPLDAVKEAFAKAFGDTATVIVAEDGTKTIRLNNAHMIIDIAGMGKFDANVTRVDGANVISTKEEIFSNVNGSFGNTPVSESITVPSVIEIPYALNTDGSQTLTIGVDFMAKMNGMDISEYSTDVVLTLDVSSLPIKETETEKPVTPVNPTESTETTNTADNSVKENKPVDTTNQGNLDETIDINNLKDGIYEIPVALWHATEDRASMAASSLNSTARIVVKNGIITVYVYTKPMTFGNITASLQEMKVQQSDGSYVNAVVETKSSDGNPTCFSFTLDKFSPYVAAKVNPHVAMMGNTDLDSRLKFDLSGIKMVSKDTNSKPLTSPKTGDSTKTLVWFMIVLASVSAFSVLTFIKKYGVNTK